MLSLWYELSPVAPMDWGFAWTAARNYPYGSIAGNLTGNAIDYGLYPESQAQRAVQFVSVLGEPARYPTLRADRSEP